MEMAKIGRSEDGSEALIGKTAKDWVAENPEKNEAARAELIAILAEHPLDAGLLGSFREKYGIPRPVKAWIELQSDVVKMGSSPKNVSRWVYYLVEKADDQDYWAPLEGEEKVSKIATEVMKERARKFCESEFGKRVAAWLEQDLRENGPVTWVVLGFGHFLPKKLTVGAWLADPSMQAIKAVARGGGWDYCELRELSPDSRPTRRDPKMLPNWIYGGEEGAAKFVASAAPVPVADKGVRVRGVNDFAAEVMEKKEGSAAEVGVADEVLDVVADDLEGEKDESWMRYTSLFRRSKAQPTYEVFAFFQSIYADVDGAYRVLAKKAREECWEASNGLWGNVDILKRYLNGTFRRLEEEDKIIYTKDGDWACFNTGLQARTNRKDILALFRENMEVGKGEDVPKWYFYKFFSTDEVDLENFPKGRAEAAEYYTKSSELVFDLEYKLMWDSVSFVEKNKEWIPEVLRKMPKKAVELIDARLKELKGQIRRDYRLVVPGWYQQTLCLFVPLYLTKVAKPDATLMLSKDEVHKCYRAQTLVPTRAAYVAARLLGRFESEWLRID